MKLKELIKKTSAWLPLAMSFTALALVVGHVAVFGFVRDADEGTAAHLWQLLMILQMPVIVIFVIKWVLENPKQGLLILGLQTIAILAAVAPVYFLNL